MDNKACVRDGWIPGEFLQNWHTPCLSAGAMKLQYLSYVYAAY